MSQNTRKEVLEKMCRRYQNGGMEHRKKLIDDAVALFGYHRKSAIRRLSTGPMRSVITPRSGRPRKNDPASLLPVLKSILGVRPAAVRQALGEQRQFHPLQDRFNPPQIMAANGNLVRGKDELETLLVAKNTTIIPCRGRSQGQSFQM